MSNLAQDGTGTTSLSLTQEAEKIEVPDWFLRYLKGGLARVLETVPKEFETWMLDKVGMNPPLLPISHVLGFTAFNAQIERVDDIETTTSTTYTDLATVGPEITNLGPGRYLLLYGFRGYVDVFSTIHMAPALNGAAADDGNRATVTQTTEDQSVMAALVELPLDSNSVRLQYHVASGKTGSFFHRWLVTLKVGNL